VCLLKFERMNRNLVQKKFEMKEMGGFIAWKCNSFCEHKI
jgi:hypothetical protein